MSYILFRKTIFLVSKLSRHFSICILGAWLSPIFTGKYGWIHCSVEKPLKCGYLLPRVTYTVFRLDNLNLRYNKSEITWWWHRGWFDYMYRKLTYSRYSRC
jgi:hypothetical protein